MARFAVDLPILQFAPTLMRVSRSHPKTTRPRVLFSSQNMELSKARLSAALRRHIPSELICLSLHDSHQPHHPLVLRNLKTPRCPRSKSGWALRGMHSQSEYIETRKNRSSSIYWHVFPAYSASLINFRNDFITVRCCPLTRFRRTSINLSVGLSFDEAPAQHPNSRLCLERTSGPPFDGHSDLSRPFISI
ncbi:hypothetical protein SCHPADRAFT_653714 [Schizopora paradoxa]|uniref:Uncharacterized protein n=1 Tax=Schizopora paradoxa TaxID=27342 RepID=A0A0H2R642_9AGAM|nr:hypothetical protein SCHPADRAFT_653714 [Schizopora paradoxa]